MAVLLYHSFNRTNNPTSTGVADTGQSLTYLYGTVAGIINNQCYSTAGDVTVGYNIGRSDVIVSLVMAVLSPYSSLIFRHKDNSNYMYLSGQADNVYKLVKVVAGVNTELINTGVTAVNGDTLKVVCNGSSITCYVNGVAYGPVTETFNQTGATNYGFYIGSTAGRIDDFLIDDGISPSSGYKKNKFFGLLG